MEDELSSCLYPFLPVFTVSALQLLFSILFLFSTQVPDIVLLHKAIRTKAFPKFLDTDVNEPETSYVGNLESHDYRRPIIKFLADDHGPYHERPGY